MSQFSTLKIPEYEEVEMEMKKTHNNKIVARSCFRFSYFFFLLVYLRVPVVVLCEEKFSSIDCDFTSFSSVVAQRSGGKRNKENRTDHRSI